MKGSGEMSGYRGLRAMEREAEMRCSEEQEREEGGLVELVDLQTPFYLFLLHLRIFLDQLLEMFADTVLDQLLPFLLLY